MNSAGSDKAQTQLLAVLFVDQVGSTAQLQKLGDLPANELRAEIESLLDRSVLDNGGSIIKRTGDGLMAVFDGASLAIDAAVDMQVRAERRNARGETDHQVGLRVGVSVGDVTVEADDCHGLSVVEAARLEQAAPTGGILCSDLTRALAGNRVDAEFVEQLEVDAKGFDAPLSAWLVEPPARHTDTTLYSLPDTLGAGGRWPFVGRDTELDVARRVWRSCCDYRDTGLLLAGEPGAGKSRLARELALEVLDEGGQVLHGRCDEGIGAPFQPFAQMLHHYAASLDGTPQHTDFGVSPGELVRLMPSLEQLLPDIVRPEPSDAETERYRLYEAVESWLEAAAERVPVLVVLDDFHWAAPQTVQLLRHLLRRSSRMRTCVVATYRDTEADVGRELKRFLADVRRTETVTTITLAGLNAEAISELVEPVVDNLSSSVVGRITTQTGGNPFFVSEVLAAVAEQGVDRLSDVGDGAVGDVVLDRVDRLSPKAADVLNVAAVANTTIGLDVLAATLNLQRSGLVPAIDDALRAGLLLESQDRPIRYRFHHALVRTTLYQNLSLLARAELHQRVALAIEQVHGHKLDGWLDDLAYHYLRAENPELADRAVEVCELAGHEAAASLGFGLAVDHFKNALELLTANDTSHPPELRGRLLLNLGLSLRRAGVSGARQAFLDASDEAERHGDVETMVGAALLNSRGFFSTVGQTDHERVDRLERAIAAMGEADTPQRSRLLANLATELTFAPEAGERRAELATQSIAIAERLGDPAVLAHALHGRISSLWNAPGLGERLVLCDRLRDLARRANLRQWKFNAAQAQFQASVECGDMDTVDQCLDEMLDMSTQFRQPVLESYVRLREGTRRIIAGDLDEGERLAVECFELGKQSGQPDAMAFYVGQMAALRYHQGRMDELTEMLPQVAENDGVPAARAASALMYCEIGETELARPLYEQLADEFDELPVDLSWLLTAGLLAESCWQLGDAERAPSLHARLAPYREQFVDNAAIWLGSAQRPLGLLENLLGRHHDADASLRAALAAHELLPSPVMTARTQVDWATCLLGRMQLTPAALRQATSLIGAAGETAAEYSLGEVERRSAVLTAALAEHAEVSS